MKISTQALLSLYLTGALAAALPNGLDRRQAAGAASTYPVQAAWPDTPFTTEGRNIKSKSGQNVVFAGANWPGAADTMIPEGLQYRSVADLVGAVKSLGMNVIRLTYAIEMVDQILDNGPAVGIEKGLTLALGADDGPKVLAQMLKNNPTFTKDTTQLEVFDAIAAECAKQQIYVHLDNHNSKAEWCCSQGDSNGWFGSSDFDVSRWQRGLGFMANHTKQWPALASMSLRNELRQGDDGSQAYNYGTWYDNVLPASAVVNGNNSLPLIFLSGENFDTDLSSIVKGNKLDNGQKFDLTKIAYGNKIVFELHKYAAGGQSCDSVKSGLINAGYGAMDMANKDFPNHAPVVMTEFGFNQMDDSYNNADYAQCLKDFLTTLPGGPGGWMQWALSGSYYIRSGTKDSDDSWGLASHDWSAWRNPDAITNYVKPFVTATLAKPKA